jgi:hypothetical protein
LHSIESVTNVNYLVQAASISNYRYRIGLLALRKSVLRAICYFSSLNEVLSPVMALSSVSPLLKAHGVRQVSPTPKAKFLTILDSS